MNLTEIQAAMENMGLAELRKLPAIINAKIAEREKAEKDAARAELAELAKTKGFEIEDLFGGSTKAGKVKTPVPPKYRNPADQSQTWSGRGRKPKWIEEALASGGQLEDFRIRD